MKSLKNLKNLSVDDYVAGILENNRTVIGRAITLIESNNLQHIDIAQEILKKILPYTGKSIRIGITGVPGAGKSTFIEALGCFLLKQDNANKIAVLAIDPSSSITGGSILGDKTRMALLSRDKRCFIRPTPSGGNLGGVARKTRETMLLCEAAGFNIIIIETVGVGQSEITVRSMVDFILLIMIAGAGDELQGIKKGIIEIADSLVINKADGDNKIRAKSAQNEYKQALHYLSAYTTGWKPHVYTCSSLDGEGIENIWKVIKKFEIETKLSGIFSDKRKNQAKEWLHSLIIEYLQSMFFNCPDIINSFSKIEQMVIDGVLTPTFAANQLIKIFKNI